MKQDGAATLLMAMVLMMSATVITLTVARSYIVEQRIAANNQWHTRLHFAAEQGLAKGLAALSESIAGLVWMPLTATAYISTARISASETTDVETEVVYIRHYTVDKFITLQSTASRNDGSGMLVHISQLARPLSVLTPMAELAPPLIITGCLLSTATGFHIRPIDADTERAGDAIWTKRDNACPVVDTVDIHNGFIRRRLLNRDLWNSVFSVSREQFTDLAAADRTRPVEERRYWIADGADMPGGLWVHSLGSEKQPVALYFPAASGCPEFGPGVIIHGLVFIDSNCLQPISNTNLSIYGSLVVNGNLNIMQMDLQLNHIQQADGQLTGLEFPVLRSVAVPGTWKDF
jgi:hypothetical protein